MSDNVDPKARKEVNNAVIDAGPAAVSQLVASARASIQRRRSSVARDAKEREQAAAKEKEQAAAKEKEQSSVGSLSSTLCWNCFSHT